jgi:hypothetical protein
VRRVDKVLLPAGVGDVKEEQRLRAVALAQPVTMDRPHDVVPRVMSLFHRVFQLHGSCLGMLTLLGGKFVTANCGVVRN